MIQESFEYFPCLFEIKQGILLGFYQNLENKILNKVKLSDDEK